MFVFVSKEPSIWKGQVIKLHRFVCYTSLDNFFSSSKFKSLKVESRLTSNLNLKIFWSLNDFVAWGFHHGLNLSTFDARIISFLSDLYLGFEFQQEGLR